ncbi:MAG: sensor histidine kinase [Burkholderiaceae bacterium]
MTPKDADTLFLRIFLLLLLAFLLSSFLAFEVFRATAPPPPWTASPPAQAPAIAPTAAHPPWISIGLDAAIKLVAGALAAWVAAGALSHPMRRLRDAAQELGRSLSPAAGVGIAVAPPQLDEAHGGREVRETARVFNELARQLKTDFETQRLLLATVSHDLRTPLTRLRMRLAELEAHPAAQRAIDDVRQMDALIESLLALFRPPGDAPGRRGRIDAFALVQAIVDDLPHDAPPVALDGTAAPTDCPPAALRRMVDNLLQNAIRHGGANAQGVAVHVSAAGARVRISIADRGPGLNAEQLASAGTPFLRWAAEQAEAEAGDDDGGRRAGLGLGLYITRALAERAGGGLALAARAGGGLVATLELPAAG